MFCRLFHQHVKQVPISRNATQAPRPIPILAPAERWVPHAGNPGMPQRPELSVKLRPDHKNTVLTSHLFRNM